MTRLFRALGQLWVRLLAVNVVLVLVPIAGLELARLHERQLLDGLERDMRNQAVLARELLVADAARGVAVDDPSHEEALRRAARETRTRIRILDDTGHLRLDSHGWGPPEGLEPPPPRWPGSSPHVDAAPSPDGRHAWTAAGEGWPEVCDRREVRAALAGRVGTMTRVVHSPPEVQLFVAIPLPETHGVVYVNRSTRPVLMELYRIRTGLVRVLLVVDALVVLATLVLAWTISRPLGKLSRAAGRIARGERGLAVPIVGSGEIKDLAVAFATMKDRLEERLRYTEEFTADVAHELKSPLTAIRGAAELLADGVDDDAARKRFLSNITEDVERLDRLVSRLLLLSRIESSHDAFGPVELAPLVERAAHRAETPDVTVRIEVASRAALAWARASDVETAVGNLLDNAVRFSPPGASVALRVEADGAQVAIVVADHGPGIPEAQRDRIFERFYTTDAERRGTGLGLAIVRSVALAHGGSVTVRETPGGGATFELRLPRPRV